WDVFGPHPKPPGAEVGLLYHHLVHAAQASPEPDAEGTVAAPAADPVTGLLELRTPAGSPLSVEIGIEHADQSRTIAVGPPVQGRPFRRGDRIRFHFQANRSCHVVLIDVGTSGTIAVIWPNAWHGDTW